MKIKKMFNVFVFGLSCFLIGTYTTETMRHTGIVIMPRQWIITSAMVLIFFIMSQIESEN